LPHLVQSFAFASLAVGVGSENPHSVSEVWCSDVCRAKSFPARIEPAVGKSSQDSAKATCAEHGTVLHEDESWSNVADHPEHLEPQRTAITLEPRAFAGAADVLAGEAAADDVDAAGPDGGLEGSDVIVDRELWPVPAQHGLAEGVVLDGADRRVAEQLAGEHAAADAGEEVHLSHRALSILERN
jgi:hypothetical protein